MKKKLNFRKGALLGGDRIATLKPLITLYVTHNLGEGGKR